MSTLTLPILYCHKRFVDPTVTPLLKIEGMSLKQMKQQMKQIKKYDGKFYKIEYVDSYADSEILGLQTHFVSPRIAQSNGGLAICYSNNPLTKEVPVEEFLNMHLNMEFIKGL